MTDAKQRIVKALVEGEAQRRADDETRAYAEKQHAITRAELVVLSAIGLWTGEALVPGDPIPIFRDGKRVATIPQHSFEPNRARVVAEASLTEDRSEINRKIKALKSASGAADELIRALAAMTYMDRLSLETKCEGIGQFGVRAAHDPLEIRLIHEIGPVVSAVVAASAVASTAKTEVGELEAELKKRETKPGRPRNEAAHAVARELARLYAAVTGKRPTYSEGPDGLSGQYTPALRDVFDALGWEATALRGPAEAAIAGISEADTQYEETGYFGLFSAPWPK